MCGPPLRSVLPGNECLIKSIDKALDGVFAFKQLEVKSLTSHMKKLSSNTMHGLIMTTHRLAVGMQKLIGTVKQRPMDGFWPPNFWLEQTPTDVEVQEIFYPTWSRIIFPATSHIECVPGCPTKGMWT